jgi:hypothetical protein
MKVERDTLRVVVPPLLALAFIAILVHPADAPPQAPAAVEAALVTGR